MRSLFEHPVMVIIISLIAGVSIFSMYVSSKSGTSGDEALSSLEGSVQRQQQRVSQLEEQVELSDDPFILEKIRRDERLLQEPEEIVLQLPPITLPSPTPEPTIVPLTPWEEWKKVLF